jgi:hypothetical protein
VAVLGDVASKARDARLPGAFLRLPVDADGVEGGGAAGGSCAAGAGAA